MDEHHRSLLPPALVRMAKRTHLDDEASLELALTKRIDEQVVPVVLP